MRLPLALSLFVALSPTLALARGGGIAAGGCNGCHGGTANTTTLSTNPATLTPGGTATLTVTISGSRSNGGFYLRSNGVGTLAAIGGQNTKIVNGEAMHSSPKSASSGQVTFQVQWTAPSSPGGVDFEVFTVMGNGSGSGGDQPGAATSSKVFGCTGTTYYRDYDGDGVGSTASGTTLNCSVPQGFAAADGDCDDSNDTIKPGSVELCNGRDDNCNGQRDEGLTSTTTWPDADGDGYGAANGTSATGCGGANRAPNNKDCNDLDPLVRPSAPELCNNRDDNCNGRFDEGVSVRCGVGWCQRLGPTCDPAQCVPGSPSLETCNLLDDDCDGVADEGDLCPMGEACELGQCTPGATPIPEPVDSGVPGTDAGTTPAKPKPVPYDGCTAAPGSLLLGCVALLRLTRRR
jgi:Putative metal-binding motif